MEIFQLGNLKNMITKNKIRQILLVLTVFLGIGSNFCNGQNTCESNGFVLECLFSRGDSVIEAYFFIPEPTDTFWKQLFSTQKRESVMYIDSHIVVSSGIGRMEHVKGQNAQTLFERIIKDSSLFVIIPDFRWVRDTNLYSKLKNSFFEEENDLIDHINFQSTLAPPIDAGLYYRLFKCKVKSIQLSKNNVEIKNSEMFKGTYYLPVQKNNIVYILASTFY